MRWFKHYTNASDDEFIAELESQFGIEGYARWWKLLEIVGAQFKKEGAPIAAYPWFVWQTKLKGKRKKLETFLNYLENKRRINLKQTENILEIEIPKMLEIRDEYTRKSGQAPDKVLPKDVDVDIDGKEEIKKKLSFFDEFKEIYPIKTGMQLSKDTFGKQVKTQADFKEIKNALHNYVKQVEHDRLNGFQRAWLSPQKFLNSFQDWENHEVEILEGQEVMKQKANPEEKKWRIQQVYEVIRAEAEKGKHPPHYRIHIELLGENEKHLTTSQKQWATNYYRERLALEENS